MASRKKILLTGASGTVGRILYMHLGPWHEVFTPSSTELNLLDRLSVLDYYRKHGRFDVVIHCAVKGANDVYGMDTQVSMDNIEMYLNLVDYNAYYSKFINIGSGAEVGYVPGDLSHKVIVEDVITGGIPKYPYGFSKNVIARDIAGRSGRVINLRLWGIISQTRIFRKLWDAVAAGETEFVIDQDRYMDYITEDELAKIVQHYVEYDGLLPKDLNMVPMEKSKVSEVIQRYIEDNGLDIKVKVTGEADTNYFGSGAKLFILGILK